MSKSTVEKLQKAPRLGTRLTEREVKVILYLWKWKLVSHAAITAKFFGDVSDVRAYNKLRDLRRAGLIYLPGDDERQRFAWSLTARGFGVAHKYLPGLRETGFRSEHFYHDYLVTAFHVGDWLVSPPKSVTFFSEQELRRLLSLEFPEWVPETDVHRPDGYWGFEISGSIVPIAIEVETSRKSPSAYLNVAEYYADCETVRRVFWLVPTQTVATWIQEKLAQATTTKTRKHNFIVVADFLKRQWEAQVVLGPERSHTIRSILLGLAGENDEKMARKFSSAKLLETRKSFVRTKISESSPRNQK